MSTLPKEVLPTPIGPESTIKRIRTSQRGRNDFDP
jgi:hypothetical protein